MRKFLLGTAALIALASSAIAADMRAPLYKAPPPVPVWSWTGCYGGGHAGGLRTHQEWINQTPGGDFFGQSLGGHDVNHWLGGVQAGCDYQFAGSFVIGIQGDYAWTDAEGSHDSAREFGVAYHSKTKSLASVTGRIGYGGGQERAAHRHHEAVAVPAEELRLPEEVPVVVADERAGPEHRREALRIRVSPLNDVTVIQKNGKRTTRRSVTRIA